MSDNHDHTPAVLEEPIANPGLPEHLPRPTDIDPVAEKRAERQVATLFGVSSVFAVLFCVAYFAIDGNDEVFGIGALHAALGVTLGLAL
ncbi:MAG: ubiquinol-cytochrome C reductase, partial [Marmoricola sp.]